MDKCDKLLVCSISMDKKEYRLTAIMYTDKVREKSGV